MLFTGVTSSNRTTSESSQTSTSVCTQTTQVLSVNTPRKKSLRTHVRELEIKCKKLEENMNANTKRISEMLTSVDHFNEVVDAHLPPNLAMLMKNYVKLASRKPQGYRYNSQLKQLALTIYFFGPIAYRFLKNILQLPTPRTLRRITQKIEIGTGLNDILFNSMELKFKNLKEDAKDCVLCVDEMAIKTNLFYNLSKDSIIGFNHSSEKKTYEPAKHVLCFMVRSLNYKWKQPVAYYFINNSCTGIPLQNTIFAVISRLQSISVNIRVFTTDQGSNFYSFANKMYVTSERPYFFVNGFKIYYVFDAPHLLKSTRNNFFKYNLEVFNNMTDKKYLNDFYKADQGINRCAPKLTDAHINPGPFQKMKVSYASQVFSATVAAGMRSCVEYGKLPRAAETTVNFIEYMDKLFDILNSRTKAASKELNLPFKNTTQQRDHLIMMIDIFNNMRVIDTKIIDGNTTHIDVSERMKFINGWKITINSLLQLWDEIQTPGYTLCTYRLNQDCLENMFGNFRNQNGNNVNPTPIQFYWAFKKVFFLHYFKHSDGANCLEDLDEIFTNIGDTTTPTLNNSNTLFPEKNSYSCNNLRVGTLDYRDLEFTSRNALSYVSGYFIKKCLEKHTCDTCLEFAKSQNNIDESFLFTHFKAYQNEVKSAYGQLNVPPDSFLNYINELDNIFTDNFSTLAIEDQVGWKIKNLLDNLPFTHPCPNFNLEFLKSLFVRLRIFHAIKKLNKSLLSAPRKYRKLDILSHL